MKRDKASLKFRFSEQTLQTQDKWKNVSANWNLIYHADLV